MSDLNFIAKKLSLLVKDKQTVLHKLVDPLYKMTQRGEMTKHVRVPADNNWFNVSFDAVEVKRNRLVISATRLIDGLVRDPSDPYAKMYIVEFIGTRAAYLRGYYKPYHPIYRWSYISWDIRSYANHPSAPSKRVYVEDFFAHNELRKLIQAMERKHGTCNIYVQYIQDQLSNFQKGIRAGKKPEQIERAWSKGLLERLGYNYVQADDTGYPMGKWEHIAVHWCKYKQDLW